MLPAPRPRGAHLLAAKAPRNGDGNAQRLDADSNDVVLRWRNAQTYDAIRILRNGTLLAEASGRSETYVDRAVASGSYVYKVIGVVAGETSFPASAFLTTVSPPGTFLRGDANHDDRVNIVDPMATLEYLFQHGAPVACEDAADTDDDGELSLSDAVLSIRFLSLGGAGIRAPGPYYPWFDPTPDSLGCGE